MLNKPKEPTPPITDVVDARKSLLCVDRCLRLMEGLTPESQRYVVQMLERNRPVCDDEAETT